MTMQPPQSPAPFPPRRIGLRGRLLLVLVPLALAPLLAGALVWYADTTAAVAERTRVLSTEVVKQVAKNIGVEMAKLESDSEALVLSEAVQDGLHQYMSGDEAAMTAARRQLMRALLDRYGSSGHISQKYLLDSDNRIVDTQVFSSLGRGVVQFVERAPHLLGRPYWSTYTSRSGQASMVLLRAIHNKSNNRLMGHLFLGVQPSHFAAIFEDVDLGQRTEVALVDADSGQLLVNGVEKIGSDSKTAPPRSLTDELRRSLARGQRSGFVAHDGERTAYARVADTSWFVVGSIAQTRLTVEARAMLESTALIGLAALVLAVLAALALARSLAAPTAAPAAASGAVAPAEAPAKVPASADDLTGLANRACFDAALDTALAGASAEAGALALLMIDLDFYAQYRAQAGPVQGDACLRAVAGVVGAALARASSGQGTTAARYGGAELALVQCGADATAAMALAEAIRAGVAALRLPHPASPLGVVTVSIGVVSLVPTAATSAAQLVGLADHAMCLARDQGRNQAVLSKMRLRA